MQKSKVFICGIFLVLSQMHLLAQQNELTAEVGVSVGAAFYFGDLNNRTQFNRPKPSMSVSFRKAFGDYLGAKVSASYAQLGYSDIYSNNEYQRRRNLSFNTNIWELAASADFHFFRFNPGQDANAFSPYLTLGVGVVAFDPYTFYKGTKVFLRPLNTEGQGSAAYPDRKPYNTMAVVIPFGLGFKYNINQKLNFFVEVNHRFTNTDYLDDVSKTYAGATAFPVGAGGLPTTAFLLQDRSNELGESIGVAGKQRGWSKQKDQYTFAQFGLTFNFIKYNCPKY
jgi:hypothetical protein